MTYPTQFAVQIQKHKNAYKQIEKLWISNQAIRNAVIERLKPKGKKKNKDK